MWNFLNNKIEEAIGAIVLAIMACISFINVIIRYCTNISFSASEELTVNLFVWIVLLGTSRAFREDGNFCMSLLYDIFSPVSKRCLYLFSTVCCIVFFSFLTYYGFVEVMDEMELNVVSESLAIPVWIYTIATPLFSLLIIFRILQKTAEDFRNQVF